MAKLNLDDRIDRLEKQLYRMSEKIDEVHELLTISLQFHSEEKIMSVKEVADFLGVGPRIIYAKCENNEIPFFRSGKYIRFKKSQLIEWAKSKSGESFGSIDDIVDRYLQKNPLKA
jgi:excisionase family DNA binding protein